MAPVMWPSDDAVALASNPGSYQKACALLKLAAVRVVGQAEAGGIEAEVKSERGNGRYKVTVPLPDGKARATCSCFDFRTRGGLCKHGAAALLALSRRGDAVAGPWPEKVAMPAKAFAGGAASPPQAGKRPGPPFPTTPPAPKKPGGGSTPLSTAPAAKRPRGAGVGAGVAHAMASAEKGEAKEQAADDSSTSDVSEMHTDEEAGYVELTPFFELQRRRRSSAAVRGPRRGQAAVGAAQPSSGSELEDLPEEAPALPRPRFPTRTPACAAAQPPAASPQGPEAPSKAAVAAAPPAAGLAQRRGAVRAAMAAKLLQKWAGLGRASEFKAELKRWGDAPLQDAGALLRRAVIGEDASQAAAVVAAILGRPEGAAAVRDAPVGAERGRTALHLAVGAGRLDVCQALVDARADVLARDATGRSALDEALQRPLEAAGRRGSADPLVELLRGAAAPTA